MKHRYMGSHASQVIVGDRSVPVEPGDFVDMEQSDVDNEDNKWLFDGDLLMSEKDFPTSAAKTTTTTPAPATSSISGGDE